MCMCICTQTHDIECDSKKFPKHLQFVAEEALRHLHTNVCSIELDHFPLQFIAVAI